MSGGFGCLIGFVNDWALPDHISRSWDMVARYVIPEVNGLLSGFRESRQYVIDNRAPFQRAGRGHRGQDQLPRSRTDRVCRRRAQWSNDALRPPFRGTARSRRPPTPDALAGMRCLCREHLEASVLTAWVTIEIGQEFGQARSSDANVGVAASVIHEQRVAIGFQVPPARRNDVGRVTLAFVRCLGCEYPLVSTREHDARVVPIKQREPEPRHRSHTPGASGSITDQPPCRSQ